MNVGDYVRFKTLSREIKIGKVIDIIEPDKESMKKYCVYDLDNNEATVDDYVIKSSPNIIDLIEIGDYVNGYLIDYIDDESRFIRSNRPYRDGMHLYKDLIKHGANFNQTLNFFEDDIKSIVTHEQFSQMEYKVGEE